MIQRLLTTAVALGCMLFAACYPVQEHSPARSRPLGQAQPPAIVQTTPAQPLEQGPTLTTPTETLSQPARPAPPSHPPQPAVRSANTQKAPAPTVHTIITASKAPGREGYVLSPYTGKLMLVSGIPSGTVVPDQTCPPSEKKFFRVP